MMGGLVIDTIRPGVQFTPDAAKAFRRAEAQLGREIDTNSTLRDWATQLRMYNSWQAYVTGRGPHPGHSKALHPSEPLAIHTKGTALDSDDWTDPDVLAILAENGFIRNRLYIPGEDHHFEYIRSRDRRYGQPIPAKRKAKRQGDITMRTIYNTDDKNDETRRAAVGELTFHVQGPDISRNERKLWGDPQSVTQAEWDSALNMVNTRRAMNGLRPLKGTRGEIPTPKRA
ncbi:hypothetical protein ABT300_44050 [Streptomyces sp. NPDC001027]|uniref:hypothetical protein n=1 Tax=Streptomyces sp. NPDC001027 TaxID=3154771 RepID=UPI00331CFF61